MTIPPLPPSRAPLDNLDALLPPHIRGIVERDTPIPSIALQAAEVKARIPTLVRADIGQITGLDPDLEVPYGPPVGLDELRSMVAETWNLTFGNSPGEGVRLRRSSVAVCTGAAEGLSVLFHCFAHRKRVGLPRGHWENYTNGVEMAQGTAILLDYFDARGSFQPQVLERVILEEKLSLIVANFPCNPTGSALSGQETAALARVLEQTGCLAIADEVYARLRYDGHPPTSLLAEAPGHAIVVSSASKEYLLPGSRVGYVMSAREDLTNRVLRKLIRANTASPNVPGQRRLLELMGPDLEDLRSGRPPRLLTRIRDEMHRRRDLLLAVLDRHHFSTVGRAGHRPAGTIFLVAALPDWWPGTDVAFAARALEDGCVSVIPGSAFALKGCVRFSYGGLTGDNIRQLDHNLHLWRESL